MKFGKWLDQVRCHKHVFLGYSTQARDVAVQVKNFIVEDVGLSVLDWHDDFRTSAIIWNSIEEGEHLTDCGVFLFMADDKFGDSKKRQLAPRDNVVYEAGYFAGAKGREYSAIIRESGAKVPSDLGGVKYLELVDRASFPSIAEDLRRYLTEMQVRRS